MKENYKVVICGPVASGKTTAIATLSDIEPVKTDAIPTDEVKQVKDETTVAMDYGVINLDGQTRVHLFGTPGQRRFDFMWDIMLEGALGLILLVNNDSNDPEGDLESFLLALSEFVGKMPFCVGVTHRDMDTQPSIAAYRSILAKHGHRNIPVFSVDARSREDMNSLLLAILGMIEPVLVAQSQSI